MGLLSFMIWVKANRMMAAQIATVRPAGTFQDLLQLIILIEESLGGCAHQNIEFIRQCGRFALGAEESVNEIARAHTEQSQEARADKRKTYDIDPLQCLIHLLRGLHELGQFLVGNTVVQQALFQSIGDQADLPMVPDHTDIPIPVGHIVLYLKLI